MNMNSKILIIVIGVIIFGAGIYYFVSNQESYSTVPPVLNSEIVNQPISTSIVNENASSEKIPATYNINIKNFAFDRASLKIKSGDTIVWTNSDTAPHTVSGNNGGPNSNTLNANQIYSFTFTNAGTFNYQCNFHPSMKGAIIVE